METPSSKLLPLITRAAELRAGASSWVKVAEHVRRSAETCRQWPRLYPELWRRLYREALGQRTAEAAVEAQLYLRKLVRHDDPKISLRAAQLLQRGWEDHSLRIWALLTLEVWNQEFIDNRARFKMPDRIQAMETVTAGRGK